MSVKLALLAMLSEESTHGYALKTEFEQRTGGTWPLNIGQVYTTLARLERDGFVISLAPTAEGHVCYEITDSGRLAAANWFKVAVERQSVQRDELAIKVAMAATSGTADVRAVIQQQRVASMALLRELTRGKKQYADTEVTVLGRLLALEAQTFQIEAELRWLDHVETLLTRTVHPTNDTPVASTRSQK